MEGKQVKLCTQLTEAQPRKVSASTCWFCVCGQLCLSGEHAEIGDMSAAIMSGQESAQFRRYFGR